MRYAMPNPELINSTYYLRLHVPMDIQEYAQGKVIHVPVGDRHSSVKVGKVLKVSLRTKSPEEAKRRFTTALAVVETHWQALRSRPSAIPHKTLVALAGQYYRDFVNAVEDEPGEPAIWSTYSHHLERLDREEDARTMWYAPTADRLLLTYGFSSDETSRLRLIEELHKAAKQAGRANQRKAAGDYRPDPDRDRFPELPAQLLPETAQPTEKAMPTLRGLFMLWERDHLANGKSPRTVGDFRQKIESLREFLGHDDAAKVTPENIADRCEHLRHERNLGARTVSQKYLSVIKLIFSLGVEKRKLKKNPAKENKVRFARPKKTRPSGFTDAEALAILKAALTDPDRLGRRTEENKRAIRWLPWICAFTGARITEAAQLRTSDLIEEGDIIFDKPVARRAS